jgi:hypothetical protein
MERLPKPNMPNAFFSIDKITGSKTVVLISLLLIAGFTGCRDPWSNEPTRPLKTEGFENQYIRMADSISYGVVIKNRDPDDTWQKKWLGTLDRQEFIDFLFDAVYSGKLQPYDYFTDEPLSPKAIRELEKTETFDRDRIGKIQFEERWYLDREKLSMVKEVYSVMLAYEVYRKDGSFRGYKPAFKVRLREELQK